MYKEHFGFRELPFANTLDPRAFYLNPVYQEALATLEHGLEAKKGVIVLTGRAGTGKTILVRKFLSNVASSVAAGSRREDRILFRRYPAHDVDRVRRRATKRKQCWDPRSLSGLRDAELPSGCCDLPDRGWSAKL